MRTWNQNSRRSPPFRAPTLPPVAVQPTALDVADAVVPEELGRQLTGAWHRARSYLKSRHFAFLLELAGAGLVMAFFLIAAILV